MRRQTTTAVIHLHVRSNCSFIAPNRTKNILIKATPIQKLLILHLESNNNVFDPILIPSLPMNENIAATAHSFGTCSNIQGDIQYKYDNAKFYYGKRISE